MEIKYHHLRQYILRLWHEQYQSLLEQPKGNFTLFAVEEVEEAIQTLKIDTGGGNADCSRYADHVNSYSGHVTNLCRMLFH